MSRQNYFIQAHQKNVLSRFTEGIEVDSNLFAYIQRYVQEVESNPRCDKWMNITFNGEYPMFMVVNNTPPNPEEEMYEIKDGIGVSLFTCPDADLSEKEEKIFKECELYSLFSKCQKEEEDYADCLYANFSFDAKSLCLAIQYLAQCYNCSLDNISVEIEEEGKETSLPLNVSTRWMFIVAAIICLLLCIFLFWSAMEFDNTEYFLAAIFLGGCMGWCIFKTLRFPN